MSDNTPDAVAAHGSIASILLVFVELIIRKDLEGKPSTENEDSQIMSPFERSRKGLANTAGVRQYPITLHRRPGYLPCVWVMQRQRERQRNHSLHDSLGEEVLEERLVPKAGVPLVRKVPTVVRF